MNKKLLLILGFIVLSILVTVAFIDEHYRSSIPDDYQGVKNNIYITSKIKSCTFEQVGKYTDEYFIGIELEGYEQLFRLNTSKPEIYQAYCDDYSRVRILTKLTYIKTAGKVYVWIVEIERQG